MESSPARIFDQWSVTSSLLVLSTACVLLLLLKLKWQQEEFVRNFSGPKQRFVSLFGIDSDIPVSGLRKLGLSYGTGMLQTLIAYCHLHAQDGIFCFFMGHVPFVVGTKAEVIQEMIGGTQMLDKGWTYKFLQTSLGSGLLTCPGLKWKPRRKLLSSCFHMDILREFLPVFNENAAILVQNMKKEMDREYIDIIIPITLCSFHIILETAFGVTIEEPENKECQLVTSVSILAVLTYDRMVNFKYWPPWYWLLGHGRKFQNHIRNLEDFSEMVFREKKEKLLSGANDVYSKKRKALMDLLLDMHIKHKALSEKDVLDEVKTFVVAGHDTTALSMSMALYLIGQHQDVQDKIHEELDGIFGEDLDRPVTTEDIRDMVYLDCVLKESQRVYSTVPMVARQAEEDIIICGRLIPKGTECISFFHMLHQDESVFPNPAKFDPDRFLPENSAKRHPYAFAPFSAGPRNCIGQAFALMEEKVVMATFLRHYTVQSLDPRDRIHLVPSITWRPSGPIRLKIRPRKTAN